MKVKCKKINVSQNQKVVLWVWSPLPQTSTVYIFLDIDHWTQSLKDHHISDEFEGQGHRSRSPRSKM